MADQIRINGNIHSWGSIKVKVAGEQYTGFTKVGFGDKLTRVLAYGMGQHQAPRARSRGKYEPEPVKLGGPPGSLQILRAALASHSTSGTSYGTVECEIVIQFFESGDTPITVECGGCTWASNSSSHEDGADPLSEDVEFTCMVVRRNGLVLFDDSAGSPF